MYSQVKIISGCITQGSSSNIGYAGIFSFNKRVRSSLKEDLPVSGFAASRQEQTLLVPNYINYWGTGRLR